MTGCRRQRGSDRSTGACRSADSTASYQRTNQLIPRGSARSRDLAAPTNAMSPLTRNRSALISHGGTSGIQHTTARHVQNRRLPRNFRTQPAACDPWAFRRPSAQLDQPPRGWDPHRAQPTQATQSHAISRQTSQPDFADRDHRRGWRIRNEGQYLCHDGHLSIAESGGLAITAGGGAYRSATRVRLKRRPWSAALQSRNRPNVGRPHEDSAVNTASGRESRGHRRTASRGSGRG